MSVQEQQAPSQTIRPPHRPSRWLVALAIVVVAGLGIGSYAAYSSVTTDAQEETASQAGDIATEVAENHPQVFLGAVREGDTIVLLNSDPVRAREIAGDYQLPDNIQLREVNVDVATLKATIKNIEHLLESRDIDGVSVGMTLQPQPHIGVYLPTGSNKVGEQIQTLANQNNVAVDIEYGPPIHLG